MKEFLSDVSKGLRIGLGVCLAVFVVWSAAVFASATWGALPDAASGTAVTSSAWNDLVSQINTLAGVFSISSGNVGIGWATLAWHKVNVNGKIHATALNGDLEYQGQWALQMAATAACVAKSTVGWVAAYKRGNSSTCNARCAASGSAYYVNCRGMVSSRWYAEGGWVNAVDWWGTTWCSTTTYPNEGEFYCCCSY